MYSDIQAVKNITILSLMMFMMVKLCSKRTMSDWQWSEQYYDTTTISHSDTIGGPPQPV